MTVRVVTLAVGAVVALAVMSPQSASAKFFLITHGEQIRDLGPVPASTEFKLPNLKVGYKNSYGGLFWVDFWTWGGEFCVHNDSGYEPVPPAVAAQLLGVPEAKLSAPFWHRFPLGLVILGAGGVLFGVMAVFGMVTNAREDKLAARLLGDPMYQDAVGRCTGTDDGGLAPGVASLADNGVPESEARANLRAIAGSQKRAAAKAG